MALLPLLEAVRFPAASLLPKRRLLRNFWQERAFWSCFWTLSLSQNRKKTGQKPSQTSSWLIHSARTPRASPDGIAFSGSSRDRSAWLSLARSRTPLPDKRQQRFIAGWSSPVARQAHNLKVIGSNPIPATNDTETPAASAAGVFVFLDLSWSK